MAFDTLVNLGMSIVVGQQTSYSYDYTPQSNPSFTIRFNDVGYVVYPLWGEAIISPVFAQEVGAATGRILVGQALYRVHYNPIVLAKRYTQQVGPPTWVRTTGVAGWNVARVHGFQYNVTAFTISSDRRYIQIDLSDGTDVEDL